MVEFKLWLLAFACKSKAIRLKSIGNHNNRFIWLWNLFAQCVLRDFESHDKFADKMKQRGFLEQACMQTAAGGSAGEKRNYESIALCNILTSLQVSSKSASCIRWIWSKRDYNCKSKRQMFQHKLETTWVGIVRWNCFDLLSAHYRQVYYNGVFDCARKMIRSEGMFALYKGILPPILVETPKRAVKFLTFEQLKPLFMFGADKPTPLVSTVLH